MDSQSESRQRRLPVVTGLLLVLACAVFALEQLFPVRPNAAWLRPDSATLIALGGLLRSLVVDDGEWYRVCSAALLHADVVHLGFNALSLAIAGALLERQLGKAWTLALFSGGAIAGSLASLWLNAPETLSVGASGAIMSLIGGALVMSLRLPRGKARLRRQSWLLWMLIPSLVPLTASSSGEGIDLASHLGGAAFGTTIGGALFVLARSGAGAVLQARAGLALALAGAALFALSAERVRADYARHALARFLMPESVVPKNVDEIHEDAARLVRDYPRDPRARLFHALTAIDASDPTLAENELRVALGDRPMLASFSPEFEARVRTFLTQTLLAQGKTQEARDAARPLCDQGAAAVPEAWRTQGLCPR
jgi:membrane associated rhomboid family serine protease